MSDYLVELGANPTARRLISNLGLPIPMPQKLARMKGPWTERSLEGKTVLTGAAPSGALTAIFANLLAETGAHALVEGEIGAGTPWAIAGEAWGRPARAIEPGAAPEQSLHGLLFDATGIETIAGLRALYDFFHPRIRSIARCGRVVVVARTPAGAQSIEATAARRAIEGFVRSLAKEVGAKGATANLISVADGAEQGVIGPVRWFLSAASAFVDGQPLVVRGGPSPAALSFQQPLAGKVVLLTGAARGIGEATAQTLAREGAKVLCLDLEMDAAALARVADRIGGIAVPGDITSEGVVRDVLAAAERAGGLDAIVHNAGITRDRTLGKMEAGKWDLVVDVNLGAIVRTTEALAPHLSDHGRIVALSSVAGIAGNFGQTNYSASKAGVVGFIHAASEAFAERGITVNGIAPGFIETRLTAAIPAATREGGRRLSALAQGGLPVDIAEAVTFLCSPGAYAVTGHVLRVCGSALIGA